MVTTDQPTPIPTLLVEDDERTRQRLARKLTGNDRLDVVAAASCFADGLRALEEYAPRVLVTDLGLPDGSGIDLIRAARQASADNLVMVVTVLGDERNVIAALKAGADSYLLKDATGDEISDSVDELIAGGSPMSPPIARHLLARFRANDAPETQDPPPDGTRDDSPDVGLSKREFEVLNLVAKGFTFREIADMLEVSPHTVRTHVRRIYDKLEVSSKSAAVYEAVSLGLIDLG